MKLLQKFFAVGLTTALTACGEGGIRPVVEPPHLPPQTPIHARQAPIVDLDGSLHIGADIAPPAGALPNIAMHGDADISHGTIRDGVGAAEMLAYLEADALTYGGADEAESPDVTAFPDGLVIRFAALPPTVRVEEGTSVALIDETVRVVQAINAALPQGWQLGFDPEPIPAGTTALTDGDILATFARQADWLAEAASPTLGACPVLRLLTLTVDQFIGGSSTAVHLMNDQVLARFEAHGARPAIVLSNSGREFCYQSHRHSYERGACTAINILSN